MTDIYQHELACPTCNKHFQASVYASINVSLDPSLKGKLMRGEINKVLCPECKTEITIASDLLYRDTDKKLWLQVAWENEQEWMEEEAKFKDKLASFYHEVPRLADTIGPIEKTYTYRLVFGYSQLREKVSVFDANLDDRIIEWIKFISILQIEPLEDLVDKQAEIEVFFEGEKEGQLSFICFSSTSDPIGFSIARDLYRHIIDDPGTREKVFQIFRDPLYVNFNRVCMNRPAGRSKKSEACTDKNIDQAYKGQQGGA